MLDLVTQVKVYSDLIPHHSAVLIRNRTLLGSSTVLFLTNRPSLRGIRSVYRLITDLYDHTPAGKQ